MVSGASSCRDTSPRFDAAPLPPSVRVIWPAVGYGRCVDRYGLIEMYGTARVALGAVLAIAPTTARPWIGEVARDPDVRSALRVLAVRDALLGVALLNTSDDQSRRRILKLCAVADAADALTCAFDFLRRRRPGAAVASMTAVGGAATGFSLAGSLARNGQGASR